ncbi:tetratricopeptide repeat protein [Iningainema tapete]|uniref:Tetratricopeptide repeat protein n=1 Tax=Iningainema tapete BLCC-T55 TaxID=2748662 RepID=A0A8J6XS68_9CYAN|nr:tetratricopeptide repeat protein [Iningainema tapete]MBD2777460.1 tetratricopeptide repeat protein [Iningainema tapete BLCC-T55]
MNKIIALISSLLLLPFPVLAWEIGSHSFSQVARGNSNCEIEPENGESAEYSEKQLQTLASRITVRVIGDHNGGSGTILAKQGNTYLVVTNSHVIRGVNSVSLQTADGKTYPAQIVPQTNFEKFDLALLKFQTNQNYCLPREIANFTPNIDMPVVAAGFSAEKGHVVFWSGKIKKTTRTKEGYEIGYTSNIEQGMSGGPILNTQGTLLGINGRSAYPILNTGYVYPNGSRPTSEEIKEMRSLSWGIPTSTFLAQVNPEILTAYSLPIPATSSIVPETPLIGWLGELEQKAKQITVKIDSKSHSNGSGIIIAKDGDTYTVLTASHVVCERKKRGEDATKPCEDDNYQILAPDGKQYPVDKSTIKREEGVDLAVVKFTSNATYQVATLVDYNPNSSDSGGGYNYMFTAGYPKLGEQSPWRFTIGRIFDKETGLLQVKDSDFQSNSSDRLQSASSLTGGYELVYTSITYGGMSGGPVLDSVGRVIGIHGRAEGEDALDNKTGDSGSSEGQVQIGYSLGIPVSTFLGLATRLGVKPQRLENTPPPQLDKQQVNSIQQAVLSADISKGNATATQWLERGNQLWRLNRLEEAVQAFDEAIKLKPSFMYLAYYGKGLALGYSGKYQEAVAAFEQAGKLKLEYAAAWYYQSIVYRELNQLNKALVAIDKAIKLQQDNPNLYNNKWAILEGSKQYALALSAISKAIEFSPRAAFYYNRGVTYHKQQKLDQALVDYNKAITLNPQLTKAYHNRGMLYIDRQKWDLALADFNKVIILNPQFASTYNNRGIVYHKQQRWDLALADYNKAITLYPQYAVAYFNRGELYKNQQKLDLALADYNKAITLNSQFTDAYNSRGGLYFVLQKWDLALADFNKAIDINPEFAKAYHHRGILYQNQQKLDLALADFNKAIELNSQFTDAYFQRGSHYWLQQKWDLALADFNKAIDINPQSADAYIGRGTVYTLIGDKQRAIQNLQQAAQLLKVQKNTTLYEVVMNMLKEL